MAEQATLRQGTSTAGAPEGHNPKGRTATIINKIHAAKNLDELFFELKNELASLFDVEQLTLYAVDREKKELYSKYLLDSLDGVQEIRVPINESSISGYCAHYGRILNIADAYDSVELTAISPHLAFDPSWDKRSGFRTRQMLAVPILVERKYLMGVLLLINKRNRDRFTADEEGFAAEIAETLGMALRNQAQLVQRGPSKFDYLLDQHLITRHELRAAIAEARRTGRDIETILLETYSIPKAELGQALSHFYGCPFLAFDDGAVVDRSLLKDLNIEFLEANLWLPLRRDGATIEVLLDNPQDLRKTEHIQRLLRGAPLRWLVGLREDIRQYLASATSIHTDTMPLYVVKPPPTPAGRPAERPHQSDIAMSALFSAHAQLYTGEVSWTWQLYNMMLLANSFIFRLLTETAGRSTVEILFGMGFGLVLCYIWFVIAHRGSQYQDIWQQAMLRFAWAETDSEGYSLNPVTYAMGVRERSGRRGRPMISHLIRKLSWCVIGLFALGYIFFPLKHLFFK